MNTIEEIFQLIDKPKLFSLPNEKLLGNDLSKLSILREIIINNVNSDNAGYFDSYGNNIALKLISFTLQFKNLDQISLNQNSDMDGVNSDTVMFIGDRSLDVDKDLLSIFDHLIDNCNVDLTQENNKGICFFKACYIFENFALLSYVFNKKPKVFIDVFNKKEIHFKYARNNYMLQFLIDKIRDLDLSDPNKYCNDFFQRMSLSPTKKTRYLSNKEEFDNLVKKQKLYNLVNQDFQKVFCE